MPHCGLPLMPAARPPRKARKRRPNGSGTVVKLSGKRNNPFQVRVNTHINANGYPAYDVIGCYPDRVSAEIALAEYNKTPFDPKDHKKLFSDVFASWYQWKYGVPHTNTGKTSAQSCMIAAYKKCSSLHGMAMWDIRPQDMQDVLNHTELSHAMLKHIRNLFIQMYKYALQYELVAKDYSQFTRITKEDDDTQCVPFTREELQAL
ncbi:MAG: hypothetical protein NC331_03515 [Lachnospiraceae bacterium]|nr:hypothetical protein [Lachnospiraceae bacterium]MCM1215697.1 hypothetical protein [Lachnospiraceae bacterium]MCM1238436.1 hypothetical protein [Lachnospiraceae bacterium]